MVTMLQMWMFPGYFSSRLSNMKAMKSILTCIDFQHFLGLRFNGAVMSQLCALDRDTYHGEETIRVQVDSDFIL